MSLPFVWVLKSKNPRLPWQSRVFENLSNVSEFHSHDANRTGQALANGHPAIDRHMRLHLFGERDVHVVYLLKQSKKPIISIIVCQFSLFKKALAPKPGAKMPTVLGDIREQPGCKIDQGRKKASNLFARVQARWTAHDRQSP
jgi:hypothetical protein